MAMNAAATPDSSTFSSRAMMAKGQRRRRSKGTIAGFASGKATDSAAVPQAAAEVNGESMAPEEHTGSTGGSSTSGPGNQPQHSNDTTQAPPPKPCHSARLALLCSQNAIRMGARTQLSLCPPGRARRGLQAALRQRTRTSQATGRRITGQGGTDTGGYFGLEKMVGIQSLDDYLSQEEFLLSTNTFDVESDEEASSGDEDELSNIEELLKEGPPSLDDERKYLNLREPLFTPVGGDSSGHGGAMASMGGGSGKLPFNRRKLRFFDSMTASDRMLARAYLQQETRRSKQREAQMLSRHLRRLQKQERSRIKKERGEPVEESDLSDQELPIGGVSQFDHAMTPTVTAALIVESLSLNPLESVEGMANCYDGIVAAGAALLGSSVNDPKEKGSRSRSEIMAALTPLLITSLEQPSGDVILNLAKLRRMCGTPRYQRRFIQRVAPSLIRPPRGAMWCLRHQNDIEPILAAAELIFDSASEIFTKGWYDRGQLLLADSKRAATLNTAAMQLRNLSTGPSDNLTLGFSGHHGLWRGSKLKAGSQPGKDSAGNESLAEWEVIAVDRQIRISISNIISMDWSKVVVHARDTDRSYHPRRSTSKRPTILPQASSTDLSPKAVMSSQLSPGRPSTAKTPVSPQSHHEVAESSSFASKVESLALGDRSASPQGGPSANSKARPLSPPATSRSGISDIESKLPSDQYSGTSNLFPPITQTPPRSPQAKPSKFDAFGEGTNSMQNVPSIAVSQLSPRLTKSSPGGAPVAKESISHQPYLGQSGTLGHPQFGGDKERAPLSPSAVGTSPSADVAPFRHVSSASSVASSVGTSGTQPAHYRMLTSTAAERKRTVAACRALRAQITRFEDAFIQLHGRPPKGAGERAPLATTYAQYREWKRAIRADAACRIQALFRGARTRWMLLRANNPRMSRVIMVRAGRYRFADQGERLHSSGQDSVLKQLVIPSEIGAPELDRSSNMDSMSGAMVPLPGGKVFNDINSDLLISQGQGVGGQPPAPQWGNQIVRRRPGSNDRPLHDGFSVSSIPKPFPSPSGSAASSVASSDDTLLMSLGELQAHKRDLKQQLKQYDMNFARKHGRMPVKAEKEPIRHLYENYNSLKTQISLMEQEGRLMASPVVAPQTSPVLSQRTLSPPAALDSGSDESLSGPAAMRGKRKQLKAPPFDQVPPAIGGSAAAASPAQDLSALKAEKGKLHQMLRSYEKDFFKEHKRQVSSFADIKPVASQYRRYKEIKKAITALQER
jgi:hypothetical protein